MEIVDGEMALLNILRKVRTEPDITDGYIERARRQTTKIMVRVTSGMNTEWQSCPMAWSMVYEQMVHFHAIFHQITDVLEKRYLGLPILYPFGADVAVQTDVLATCHVSTQFEIPEPDADVACDDVSSSEVILINEDSDWASSQEQEGIQTPSQREQQQCYDYDRTPQQGGRKSTTQREQQQHNDHDQNPKQGERQNTSQREQQHNHDNESLRSKRHRNHSERDHYRNDSCEYDRQRQRREKSATPARPFVSRNRFGEPHCWLCDRDHPLHACPHFRAMSSRERLRVISEDQYDMCHNCFCFGHFTSGCWKTNGCRCESGICQCGSPHRHNSLLCNGFTL